MLFFWQDGCINLERGEVFFADKLDDSHLAIEAEETLFKQVFSCRRDYFFAFVSF